MTPDRRRLVEDLFHAALDRGPEFLDEACAGDDALKAEIAGLLASYQEWSVDLPPPVEEALPRFGPYSCDQVLGAGGMGTVYRAHRADGQFNQSVAIKVLRGSLRTDWYRERFLAERQTLATLNHPHIARLLDGGMTEDGEPYLVMELVEGEPIDTHCDRLRLTVDQRVDLFCQVLDAVDYAHRNLVVHRDLKPSNILVTKDGGVKLVDFGTSKLLEQDSTATAMRMLTPRWASPEQLRGEAVAISSDVYSSGLVLYELLVGGSPFGESQSVLASLERAAGNVSPAAPASLVNERAATARSTTLKALSKALAGDLGSILLKPLAQEAAARYPGAGNFREDLESYRAGLAVRATPPTLGYRLRKFVARHRWAVAATSGAMALLIAAGVYSRLEANRAQRRFEDVRQLARFVMSDLNTGLQRLPGSTTLQKQSVERSLEYLDRLSKEAGGDVALRLDVADGYRRLGDVLGNPFRANLGERARAEAAYRSGLAVLQGLAPNPAARHAAAELHLQLGGTHSFGVDSKQGIEEVRRAVAELKDLVAAAPGDVDLRLAAARGFDFLGTRVTGGGGSIEAVQHGEAETHFAAALAQAEAVLARSPNHTGAIRQLAQTENSRALLYGSTEPGTALKFHRRAIEWLDKLPAGEAAAIDARRLRVSVLMNTGWAEGQAGQHAQAIAHISEAGDLLAAWSAADPENTFALYQLTAVHRSRGIVHTYRKQDGPAAKDFLAGAELHRRLTEKDPRNKIYRYLRGELLVRAGNSLAALARRDEARQRTREGLEILEGLAAAPNASTTHVFGACRWLCETEVRELRKPARAAEFCRLAMKMTGGEDPDAYSGLANALDQMGDAAGAVAAAGKALALIPPTLPGTPPTQQRRDMEAGLLKFRAKAHRP
jgi:tetratricopeptide (TPR) repeat protein